MIKNVRQNITNDDDEEETETETEDEDEDDETLTSQEKIERRAEELLAKALAALSGHTEAPPPKSLLTGSPGKLPCSSRMSTTNARFSAAVTRHSWQKDRRLSSGVGKITFFARNSGKNGAAFDVSYEFVQELLDMGTIAGFEVSKANSLRDLERQRKPSGRVWRPRWRPIFPGRRPVLPRGWWSRWLFKRPGPRRRRTFLRRRFFERRRSWW